jgi:amino acid permease
VPALLPAIVLFLLIRWLCLFGAVVACAQHCSSYPVEPGWISRGQTAFATFFGFAIYCGPSAVERLNTLCMCGAVLAFGLLVRASTVETPSGDLDRADWGELEHAIPVIVVAFSYHNIVPSVFNSLENSTVRKLVRAICSWITSKEPSKRNDTPPSPLNADYH